MTATEDVSALDAMIAAPDHHEVLLENDRVRVLDTRLGPGERTPIHTHSSPATLYVMSWSDFLRRDADGNVIVDSRDWEPDRRSARRFGCPPSPAFG